MTYDRDRLLGSLDLRDLADQLLGPSHQNRRTHWPCPMRDHQQTGRTPPLSVFVGRSGIQRWNCHGCGEGGTAVDLVMATLGVEVGEAFEWLANRSPDSSVSFERSRDRFAAPHRQRPRPVVQRVDLDPYVEECFRLLHDSPKGRPVLDWLVHTRAIPEELLRHHRIGLDPGVGRIERPPGVPTAYGVVLPIREGGRTVFTQTRRLNVGAGGAKYLSCSHETAPNPRFGRFDPPSTSATCVVVCEGAFDAMSANAAGLPAVALLGAGVGRAGISRMVGPRATTVLLALDQDAAGERARGRLRSEFHELGSRTRDLRFPAGFGDLNEWSQRAAGSWSTDFAAACRDACTRGIGRGRSVESV